MHFQVLSMMFWGGASCSNDRKLDLKTFSGKKTYDSSVTFALKVRQILCGKVTMWCMKLPHAPLVTSHLVPNKNIKMTGFGLKPFPSTTSPALTYVTKWLFTSPPAVVLMRPIKASQKSYMISVSWPQVERVASCDAGKTATTQLPRQFIGSSTVQGFKSYPKTESLPLKIPSSPVSTQDHFWRSPWSS